jgi:flagellar FliL protein
MAKNESTVSSEAGEAAPKKKRGKFLLVVVAAIALTGAGAGGGYWFWHKGATAEAAAPAPKKPAYFFPLDLFTVNLQRDDGDRYLQVALVLQVSDPSIVDQLKQQTPVIRNKLLLLLSSKSADELLTVEGKEKLSDEILTATRAPLPGTTPDKGVESVLFSSFIVQ